MNDVKLQPLKVADVENLIVTRESSPEVNNDIKELAKSTINTGMIMDAIETSEEADVANENMQAALENNRMAQIQAMMAARKQKVREYKVGRNEKCPCGSGKKYKNCCLSSGTYEKLIDKK